MPAAAVVTIIAVVVVVLVLAGFLLTTARVLVHVNRQLEAVLAAVGTIASTTKAVNPAVRSIDSDLGTARDILASLLESKVGADGAAQLVASVDPLAEAPAPERTRDDPARVRRGDDLPPAADEPEAAGPEAAELEPAEVEPDLDRSQRPFPGGGGGEIRLRDRED